MFAEGVVKSYNMERGFGFIAIEGNKKDLFFHITDFPNKSIDPKIGEKLKFRIVDEQGKLKADNIVRLDVKIESVDHFDSANRRRNDYSKHQNSLSLNTQNRNSDHRSSQNRNANNRHSQNRHSRRRHSDNTQSSGGFGVTIVGLIVIVGLVYMIYGKYQRAQLANQPAVQIQQVATPANSNPSSSSNSSSGHYTCDGRVHCSQMNSREEARWFVRNCPGTKMDGNHDGEPCERDSRW